MAMQLTNETQLTVGTPEIFMSELVVHKIHAKGH